MRTRIVPLLVAVGIAAPASLALGAVAAAAATISASGTTLAYTAAPGEDNLLLVSVNEDEGACGRLPSPCLDILESDANPVAAPDAPCVVLEGGSAAQCRLPTAMVIALGDGIDGVMDWDGPSTIDMGPGDDALVHGNGGDDVIFGGEGDDVLNGHAGDDMLDGGPGDDALEGMPHSADGASTAGADTYVGGGGADSLTYETRVDPLAISLDGQPNDGAAGEGDNVDPGIRTVVGGGAGDLITGSGGDNALDGLGGNDRLQGFAGDDVLVGGPGDDELLADAGQDTLVGEEGDDALDGGPGVDRFWGDGAVTCADATCAGGADRIAARDGAAEHISCGAGADSATVDPIDIVAGSAGSPDACERVQQTGAVTGRQTPQAGGPSARRGVRIRRITVDRRQRVWIRLVLPSGGRVTARASIRVTRGERRRVVALGSASASKRQAGAKTLRVVPSRRARSALRRLGRVRVIVRVTFRPARDGAARVAGHTQKMRGPSS